MESLYLRGHTIQEVGGKMMIGSSIYGVAVIDGSLYAPDFTVLYQRTTHMYRRPCTLGVRS